MNLYKFECVVWVQGESREEALKELHDEADYHFGQDNNLIALQSDEGVFVEEMESIDHLIHDHTPYEEQ